MLTLLQLAEVVREYADKANGAERSRASRAAASSAAVNDSADNDADNDADRCIASKVLDDVVDAVAVVDRISIGAASDPNAISAPPAEAADGATVDAAAEAAACGGRTATLAVGCCAREEMRIRSTDISGKSTTPSSKEQAERSTLAGSWCTNTSSESNSTSSAK